MPPSLTTSLPDVRRLEAVSFRSWPATRTRFDGTWAIRLTAGHPAKRLNSVNALDPADHVNLEQRILNAQQIFQDFGRPLIFRQSPLAPPELDNILDARGWLRFDETRVMTLPVSEEFQRLSKQPIITTDIGHWIDQSIEMGSFNATIKPGMFELINAVEGQVALFLDETVDSKPNAAALAVRFHDQVGIFELVSNPGNRKKGFGIKIMHECMAWAQIVGASRLWLQVETENEAANRLYEKVGFTEAYRYIYRQAPGVKHEQ